MKHGNHKSDIDSSNSHAHILPKLEEKQKTRGKVLSCSCRSECGLRKRADLPHALHVSVKGSPVCFNTDLSLSLVTADQTAGVSSPGYDRLKSESPVSKWSTPSPLSPQDVNSNFFKQSLDVMNSESKDSHDAECVEKVTKWREWMRDCTSNVSREEMSAQYERLYEKAVQIPEPSVLRQNQLRKNDHHRFEGMFVLHSLFLLQSRWKLHTMFAASDVIFRRQRTLVDHLSK